MTMSWIDARVGQAEGEDRKGKWELDRESPAAAAADPRRQQRDRQPVD
jgi:hypothetical protein